MQTLLHIVVMPALREFRRCIERFDRTVLLHQGLSSAGAEVRCRGEQEFEIVVIPARSQDGEIRLEISHRCGSGHEASIQETSLPYVSKDLARPQTAYLLSEFLSELYGVSIAAHRHDERRLVAALR